MKSYNPAKIRVTFNGEEIRGLHEQWFKQRARAARAYCENLSGTITFTCTIGRQDLDPELFPEEHGGEA